jgi:hypothetical protein
MNSRQGNRGASVAISFTVYLVANKQERANSTTSGWPQYKLLTIYRKKLHTYPFFFRKKNPPSRSFTTLNASLEISFAEPKKLDPNDETPPKAFLTVCAGNAKTLPTADETVFRWCS